MPNGLNDSGQIVGAYFNEPAPSEANSSGFLYSGGTFTNLQVPGASYTGPIGINDFDKIVGFYHVGGSTNFNGFVYSNGTYTTLTAPGGPTIPYAINNLRQIVAQSVSSAILYTASSLTTTKLP